MHTDAQLTASGEAFMAAIDDQLERGCTLASAGADCIEDRSGGATNQPDPPEHGGVAAAVPAGVRVGVGCVLLQRGEGTEHTGIGGSGNRFRAEVEVVANQRATGGRLQAHPLECRDVGFFAEGSLPDGLALPEPWVAEAFAAIRGEEVEVRFDAPRDPAWAGDPDDHVLEFLDD